MDSILKIILFTWCRNPSKAANF